MTYGEPEPDDPNLLVGVAVPAAPGAAREMAEAFADEFAQLGMGREQLLRLFRSPFYAGAHAARRLLGDAEIERLVDESLRVHGRRRHVVTG